jgi:hypothetical protein
VKPLLSVVVVHYDIPREFPRTLHSLSPAFQRDIDPDDYEVVVVDNGSPEPPDLEEARALGLDVRLVTVEDPRPSPCRAINIGINATCGRWIGVLIDGARMLSPRLLATTREALEIDERAVVGTRGRYLGPGFQRFSMHLGYTRDVEDRMLDSIDWKNDGYRLFEVSVFDESADETWLHMPYESNTLFAHRNIWHELGGYDEAFESPGGGYVNLDTWDRACSLPGARPIVLVGEATFHQLHGGVATNAPEDDVMRMHDEYVAVRGKIFEVPKVAWWQWGRFAVDPAPDELRQPWLGIPEPWEPIPGHPPTDPPRSFARRVLDRLVPARRRLIGAVAAERSARLADEIATVRDSSLFDAEWYRAVYPDVAAAGVDPAEHYVRNGAFEGRHPGPDFDTRWYFTTGGDVYAEGMNPLVHYERYGKSEGRSIRPAFTGPHRRIPRRP